MPVRLTSDGTAPAIGINNVTLRDTPDAAAIRRMMRMLQL
jgi:hypothetical protein